MPPGAPPDIERGETIPPGAGDIDGPASRGADAAEAPPNDAEPKDPGVIDAKPGGPLAYPNGEDIRGTYTNRIIDGL